MVRSGPAFWRTVLLGAAALVAVSLAGLTISSNLRRAARFEKLGEEFELLDHAIASFAVDRCGAWLPMDSFDERGEGVSPSQITFSTVRIAGTEGSGVNEPLTTPIGYIAAIPRDPFSPHQPMCYVRPSLEPYASVAILISTGPDGDHDLDQVAARQRLGALLTPSLILPVYGRGEIHEMLAATSYDPTNGAGSSGDLFRVYESTSAVYGWGLPNPDYSEAPRGTPEEIREFYLNRGTEWSEGDPVPLGGDHFLSWQRSREWPVRLLGAYQSDSETWRKFIAATRNRIGPNFGDFIANPRPLTPVESSTFHQWRDDSPDWWALIDDLSVTDGDRAPVGTMLQDRDRALLGTLPLIGKSAAVRAAAEMAEENWDAAAQSLEVLRLARDLAHLPMQADPWAYRIECELSRINQELVEQMPGEKEESP